MVKPLAWGLLLALLLSSPGARAHKPSDSYLSLDIAGSTVDGQWDIALRDLDFAIGIDGNDDGAITWGELRGRHPGVASYALSRLTIRSGGAECPARPTEHLVDDHSDGAYAVLRFTAECGNSVTSLEIDYALFLDIDPQHRGLVSARHQGVVQTAIFGAERPVQNLSLAGAGPARQFLDYVREGVRHIWIGYDHILFLITLLLPAVLRRCAGRWVAVTGVREAALDVVAIVTAFTIAHSISLGLAVLGVISLPTRLVESAIAATVVIVALNNLVPVVTRRLWLAAFGFGLIHGLGFASVLVDLGLPDGALIRSLIGFNLGVEVGQLAIVLVLLPITYWLRGRDLYRRVVLRLGSLAVAVLAGAWLVQRAFDIAPLPS